MSGNLPDDWNNYWRRCDRCGQRYHASEGGCSCLDDQESLPDDAVLLDDFDDEHEAAPA